MKIRKVVALMLAMSLSFVLASNISAMKRFEDKNKPYKTPAIKMLGDINKLHKISVMQILGGINKTDELGKTSLLTQGTAVVEEGLNREWEYEKAVKNKSDSENDKEITKLVEFL